MTPETVKKIIAAAFETGFLQKVLTILADDPDIMKSVLDFIKKATKK